MNKMSRMKRFMVGGSAVTLILMLICFIVMRLTYREFFLRVGIFFMVICIHFTIRFVIGSLIGGIPLSGIDPNKIWYLERGFEQRLYKFLRVKKWKKRLPFYDTSLYSVEEHTPDELLRIVCRSEIVHWFSAAASLLTILITIPFRTLPAFMAAGIIGALGDMIFVIVQRYNRPRIEQTAVNYAIHTARAEQRAAAENTENTDGAESPANKIEDNTNMAK